MIVSSFMEGVPVVLMEAMAKGRAVLATAVGGVPELVMPGLSGPELVERLRIERSSLHALYMSGYPEPSDPVKSDLDPTVNLIEKPFAPDEILRRVRRALDAR